MKTKSNQPNAQAAKNPTRHQVTNHRDKILQHLEDLKLKMQRDRNIYRCFRCGSAGSVIDFWSAYRGLPIYAAANDLSIKQNCEMQPETSNRTDDTAEPKKQQLHSEPPREIGLVLDRD